MSLPSGKLSEIVACVRLRRLINHHPPTSRAQSIKDFFVT